jgi:glutathione S-transferase
MATISKPTLWHIKVSHYSEKVRWALDYKGIPYDERTPLPGLHMPVAWWLTRGRSYTVPLIVVDGERIGDSTAIVAALEERQPEPPLYPGTPAERRRALALEDWFDEELGPYVRRFVFHELMNDPDCFSEIGRQLAPRAFGPVGRRGAQRMVVRRYRAQDDDAAEAARAKVLVGFDRLEEELGGGDYLAGGAFSVADLTAAALLYPLVRPPEATMSVARMPEPVEELRARLSTRRGYRWVEEMFRRHRRPASADAPDSRPPRPQ